MRIMSVQETATRLNVRPKSLLDKRFRARIGLAAVHIGRRIGFVEGDIERLIIRGREKLPVGKERGNSRCSKALSGVAEAPCEHIG